MTGAASIFSRPAVAVVIVLLAIALDQAIKFAVETHLPMEEAVPVIPMLALYRTYNLGVAFSLLSGMEREFIIGMRVVIVAFVLWLWRRSPKERTFAHLGFTLIVAGALGNLVDGFLYGHVIDYILFYTSTWSFAVFNLADSFISIGAVLVILDELFVAKPLGSPEEGE
ncbi:signal peptidase II [Pseudorhizobium endolithicum]|uniref:Lipoprotein signal peptidase n=1 Tax=Pseudorhizobium endolithicum TaxID=1191678 RepID=A0ABN7K035_9HYPH|nr:signal peptidase II [Pseudorhizobium endolithicum]CAD7052005.1 signal peptidase II [Pseudorhizobium endolithicum]